MRESNQSSQRNQRDEARCDGAHQLGPIPEPYSIARRRCAARQLQVLLRGESLGLFAEIFLGRIVG